MANPEHLEILKQGVEAWNRWSEDAGLTPDLSGADLKGMDLPGINFSDTNLSGADLSSTPLMDRPGIGSGDFDIPSVIDMSEPIGADLAGANFEGADLRGTNLHGADLYMACFIGARLEGANLRGAKLEGTNFARADLTGADLFEARLRSTAFIGTDLTRARGLIFCIHTGPSAVDGGTVAKSPGLPEKFLLGCGQTKWEVEAARLHQPELTVPQISELLYRVNDLRSEGHIQFYSCFISYSSKDQEFAHRLHSDLQAMGVRAWFAPDDLKIGARIRPAIDESIRVYDKLLLVLSEHSVSNQWVEQEVETALARERESEGKTLLFPIRIDDAVMEIKTGWPALLRNTRNIGDFTDWKDHDSYRKAFDRLLRDLKAEVK